MIKSKKVVRLAILGTGRMADYHAERFREVANCQILAAVDVDRTRAEAFCKKHGIPTAYTNLEDVLARTDIDAVSNVTPDGFHAPLSIKCLKAGKHVLCEKPLALNYPDARRMVSVAQKAGLINMVSRRATFSPGFPARSGATGARLQPGSGASPHHMGARARSATWVCTSLTLPPTRLAISHRFIAG